MCQTRKPLTLLPIQAFLYISIVGQSDLNAGTYFVPLFFVCPSKCLSVWWHECLFACRTIKFEIQSTIEFPTNQPSSRMFRVHEQSLAFQFILNIYYSLESVFSLHLFCILEWFAVVLFVFVICMAFRLVINTNQNDHNNASEK